MSKGQENVYTCQKCGGYTVTIDRDEGTTPFMIRCRAKDECKGEAYSSFYPKGPRPAYIPPPAWEWYRPTDTELLLEVEKHPKSEAGIRQHVEMGGLLMRQLYNA